MTKRGLARNGFLSVLICASGLWVSPADPPEALAADAATIATWTAETVEGPNDLSPFDYMGVSLAYDPGDGQPSIAYIASAKGALKFAHWTGSSWAIEVVDKQRVNWVSLGYEAPGVPNIVYRRSTDLRFAKKVASAWSFQAIDRNVGLRSSLAFDPLGRPAIAYMVGGKKTNVCKLARWSGALWSTEVVDNATCGWISVGFRGSVPAVAYNDKVSSQTGPDTLKYAEKPGSSWVKATVTTAPGYSDGGDLAIGPDPDRYPGIVYKTGGYTHPGFAYQDATGWHTEDIELCNYCGYNPQLVYHGATPWVSYISETPDEPDVFRVVNAAYRDAAGQWIVERVESDPVNLNAWFSSIAFPPGGDQPGVAHMFPSYALRFARRAVTP
ncbi:MAG: hypothetical protein KBD01_16625 [Acidobacteria bacterium]|nr:hypothetical protein [Acidobacteriota bacterium]